MIDWARVLELYEEVGAEDFADVAAIFLEEVDDVIGRLHDGPPQDPEADFHFLKGSALNLGFATLAELCSAAEKAAREDGAEVAMAAIFEVYDASRSEFLSGLSARKLSGTGTGEGLVA